MYLYYKQLFQKTNAISWQTIAFQCGIHLTTAHRPRSDLQRESSDENNKTPGYGMPYWIVICIRVQYSWKYWGTYGRYCPWDKVLCKIIWISCRGLQLNEKQAQIFKNLDTSMQFFNRSTWRSYICGEQIGVRASAAIMMVLLWYRWYSYIISRYSPLTNHAWARLKTNWFLCHCRVLFFHSDNVYCLLKVAHPHTKYARSYLL